MARPREKLSTGGAAVLADAPPVAASAPAAVTASASAARTIVLYMAAPRPMDAVCGQYREARRFRYKRYDRIIGARSGREHAPLFAH